MNEVTIKNYQNWLKAKDLDKSLLLQIKEMSEKEIIDAFSLSLQFGTAGIRGIVGPGTNRMNIYTIRKTALAFGRYLLNYYKDAKMQGVVIAYDNRHYSKEFCLESAKVLTSLGIKTYVFGTVHSTPELSFAIRKLGCAGGVVITASHNPKEYNGFKVYDHNGCQLTPNLIDKLKPFYDEIINETELEFFPNKEIIEVLDKDFDNYYYKEILSLLSYSRLDFSSLSVVYTPQHGTGYRPMKIIFEELGCKVNYVEKQCTIDPNFSHTLTPNPEDKKAFVEAIEIAKINNAHLIISTDPDSDRIGVVEMNDNIPHYFSGNQLGALFINYLLKDNKEYKNKYMFDTIVSNPLAAKIARAKGVEVFSTLTGFKFIGEQIELLKNKDNFIFGYEESNGYLFKPFVRDKDGFQASLIMLEMKNYYYLKNKSLVDVLDDIYKEHGCHYDEILNFHLPGVENKNKVNDFVDYFRNYSIDKFGNETIKIKEDYLTSKVYEKNKEVGKLYLPTSNVIRFILEDDSQISIRPSGTEPKCKIYLNLVASSKEKLADKIEVFKKEINEITNKL